MLIFINGSINSGKTTVSKLLAEKLGAAYLNVDDLNDSIPNFDLNTDIPKSFDLAISRINELHNTGKDVVANYVVGPEDWDRLLGNELLVKERLFVTLAPRLEVAQSNRGDRQLTDWEVKRVKYHYDIGVATPKHGSIIDNSDISVEETVKKIQSLIS